MEIFCCQLFSNTLLFTRTTSTWWIFYLDERVILCRSLPSRHSPSGLSHLAQCIVDVIQIRADRVQTSSRGAHLSPAQRCRDGVAWFPTPARGLRLGTKHDAYWTSVDVLLQMCYSAADMPRLSADKRSIFMGVILHNNYIPASYSDSFIWIMHALEI